MSCVGLVEVEIVLTSAEQVVEVFFGAGLLEWEDALHDYEQNDSEAEHVNLGAIILLALLDLGSHVGEGTSVALEAVDVLVAGESKVSKLEVELVVHQDVLKFEVAVNNSVRMHVLHGIEHLVSEEATSILSHGAHGLADVEKKTALDEFHDEVNHVVDNTA